MIGITNKHEQNKFATLLFKSLTFHTFLKENFEHEYYLTVLPLKYMHSLAKLRLSSHKLRIESGRYGESRI